MSSQIAIDTEQLNLSIEKMETNLTNIRSKMTAMYEAVRLLDGMWDGPANTAFKQQFELDKTRMEELCNEIEEYIGDLRFAKEQYVLSENRVGEIIARINV